MDSSGNEYLIRGGFRFPMDGKVDVFVLNGQSHAEGQGLRDEIFQKNLIAYAENSFRYNSAGSANGGVNPGDWGPLQVGVNTDGLPHTGTDFGVETAIAAYYYANYLKPSYWVKSAFGGVGISEELRGGGGSFHPDPAFSIFPNLTNPLIGGINRLSTQYGISISDCRFHFIWIQGETDSNYSPDDADYGTNWDRIYGDLISALDASFTGFSFSSETDVLVNPAFDGLPLAGVNLVNNAKIAWVAVDATKREYVDIDQKLTIASNNHYEASGTIHLGREIFKKIFLV